MPVPLTLETVNFAKIVTNFRLGKNSSVANKEIMLTKTVFSTQDTKQMGLSTTFTKEWIIKIFRSPMRNACLVVGLTNKNVN